MNIKKTILCLVSIFVLGNVSGAFLGARIQEERHEKRDKVDNLEVNMMELLERKLSLEPTQVVVVEQRIGEACLEIREIYRQGGDDIELVFRKYHDLIAKELTPDQDKIFKELEAMRRKENLQLLGD